MLDQPHTKTKTPGTNPGSPTNTTMTLGVATQMITNVSTPDAVSAEPLIARPETRTEAKEVIMALAAGATMHDECQEYVDQCARILSVCLWHDVDQTDFSLLVEDITKAELLRAGGSVAEMFGEEDDTPDKRGEWLFYYETQINWRVDQVLDAAGYRR